MRNTEEQERQSRVRDDDLATVMLACHSVSTFLLYLSCVMIAAYFPGPVLRGAWSSDATMAFAILVTFCGAYVGIVFAVWLLTAPWAKRRNWLASLPMLAFFLRLGLVI